MAGLLKGFKTAKDKKTKRHLIALLLSEHDIEKTGLPQLKLDLMFVSHVTTSPSTFTSLVDKHDAACILIGVQSADNKHISYARKKHPCAFIIITHSRTCNNATARMEAVRDGANMITELDNADLQQALEMVSQLGKDVGPYVCPYCHTRDFTQKDLWIHCPLYHINVPNSVQRHRDNCCPICMNIQSLPMMVRMMQVKWHVDYFIVRYTSMMTMLHLKSHILEDLNCMLLHLWCASDLVMINSFLFKSLVAMGEHIRIFHYIFMCVCVQVLLTWRSC